MWPGLLRRMLLHCNADSFEQEAGRRVSGFGTGGLGCQRSGAASSSRASVEEGGTGIT